MRLEPVQCRRFAGGRLMGTARIFGWATRLACRYLARPWGASAGSHLGRWTHMKVPIRAGAFLAGGFLLGSMLGPVAAQQAAPAVSRTA